MKLTPDSHNKGDKEQEFKDLLSKLSKLGKAHEEGRLFAEAQRYDEFIYSLAVYHTSMGLTQPADPKAVLDCFAEFKGMIAGNEATVAELEKLVVGKFSVLGHLSEVDKKIVGFSNDNQEAITT